MESKTQTNDIPTALPGCEDDNAREKLLLETTATESDIESGDDEADLLEEERTPKPMKKRRWHVMRTVVGFGIFLGFLAFGVTWFFGMGWFAKTETQPVSRNASKEAPASPATEDEKLKMALSMVAANESKTGGTSAGRTDPAEMSSTSGSSTPATNVVGDIRVDSGLPIKASSGADASPFALPSSSPTPTRKESASEISEPDAAKKEAPASAISRTDPSTDAHGRSLFFGVTRKTPIQTNPVQISESTVSAIPIKETPSGKIPFGTLLPVRLVGSIYTIRNSGGFVRMELTRTVEGKDFSYPAGTTVVGNARGGESARAFVTVIGLIDPVSGELVKFSGELLGKDGASGIEGKRQRLTSQWSRFFDGLKDTASSVLGSVGAIRSRSTVVLSEPIRRGSALMSEDFSDALLWKDRDKTTFIEVAAGASGYVLVSVLTERFE